ncbi:MAG: hypothetical protein HRT54_05615 [Colwellia sp.]|nr:hypothetical protein [Colwellia sp.]
MRIPLNSFFICVSALVWLFIAENAVTELIFSPSFKQFIVLSIVLITLLFLLIKFKIWFTYVHCIHIAAFLLALVSLLLRSYYIEDENLVSFSKTLFKFLSVFVLLIVIEQSIANFKRDKLELRLPKTVQFLFLCTILSFILYILHPMILYTFYDHSGHEIKLVYGSLSSSVYQIGSAKFSRLNFIFDEPGTFGMFISFVISYMYYLQKKITTSMIIVICVGIASVSLAYFLFLCCFFIYIALKNSLFQFNIKSIIWGGVVVLLISGLFNLRSEVKLIAYIADRFESISSNDHNRSKGNSEALNIVFIEPLGVTVKDFDERRFSSSGLFVISAYHGVLYALSFLCLYMGFIYSLFKRGGDCFPLIIAISLTILSRNNLFNYSGVALMLLANYICYLSIISKGSCLNVGVVK